MSVETLNWVNLGKGQHRLDLTFNQTIRNDLIPDPTKWIGINGMVAIFASATALIGFNGLSAFFDTIGPQPDQVDYTNAPSDVESVTGRFLPAQTIYP